METKKYSSVDNSLRCCDEQFVLMRCKVFKTILVGCCFGLKDDASMVLIFFILLLLYSDLKFLSLCLISKVVLPLYDIVVSRKSKLLFMCFSSLSVILG